MALDSNSAGVVLTESKNPSTRVEVGGNSSVARVTMAGIDYAVKDYSKRSDGFLRQQREWFALTFLNDVCSGLAPTPHWCFEDQPTLIYSWVTGSKPKWQGQTVSAMTRILGALRDIYSQHPNHHNLPLAVDSATDIGDLSRQITCRLIALNAANNSDLGRISQNIGSQLEVLNLTLIQTRMKNEPRLTLSPSDFGPHNMIHDSAKSEYRIIDLEFFGVDDVHKLIGDTVLHPQISWTPLLLQKFLKDAEEIFNFSWERLNDFLPFLSLKWAVIVAGRMARGGNSWPKNQESRDVEDLAIFYSDLSRLGQSEDVFSRIVERSTLRKTPNPSDGEN